MQIIRLNMESKQLKTCGLQAIRIGEECSCVVLLSLALWKLELSFAFFLSPPSAVFSLTVSIILSSNLAGCIAEQFSPTVR